MRSTHRPPPVTVGRTEPEPRPPNATPRPFPALLARPALPLQTRVVVESRSRLLAAFSTGWAELARGARGRTGLTRDSSSARRTSLRDAVTPASSPRRRNAQPEPRAPRAGRAGSAARLQSASPPHRPQHHEAPPARGASRGPRRLRWPRSATRTGKLQGQVPRGAHGPANTQCFRTRGHPGLGGQRSAAGAACVQRRPRGGLGGRRPFHGHTGALPAEQ